MLETGHWVLIALGTPTTITAAVVGVIAILKCFCKKRYECLEESVKCWDKKTKAKVDVDGKSKNDGKDDSNDIESTNPSSNKLTIINAPTINQFINTGNPTTNNTGTTEYEKETDPLLPPIAEPEEDDDPILQVPAEIHREEEKSFTKDEVDSEFNDGVEPEENDETVLQVPAEIHQEEENGQPRDEVEAKDIDTKAVLQVPAEIHQEEGNGQPKVEVEENDIDTKTVLQVPAEIHQEEENIFTKDEVDAEVNDGVKHNDAQLNNDVVENGQVIESPGSADSSENIQYQYPGQLTEIVGDKIYEPEENDETVLQVPAEIHQEEENGQPKVEVEAKDIDTKVVLQVPAEIHQDQPAGSLTGLNESQPTIEPQPCVPPTQNQLTSTDSRHASVYSKRTLPYDLRFTICCKLDADHPLGYDWRSFASNLGADHLIDKLHSRYKDPTSELLKIWDAKDEELKQLVERLHAIKRSDVATLVDKYITDQQSKL